MMANVLGLTFSLILGSYVAWALYQDHLYYRQYSEIERRKEFERALLPQEEQK